MQKKRSVEELLNASLLGTEEVKELPEYVSKENTEIVIERLKELEDQNDVIAKQRAAERPDVPGRESQ